MRSNLATEKNRFATRKKRNQLIASQDEVGRWLGERLKAALHTETSENPKMSLMRDSEHVNKSSI
jgi:hypothetical protein